MMQNQEIVLHTDNFIQIFNMKNRILYQTTDAQQNLYIQFDQHRQSYVFLNASPNQVQLTELLPIDAEQLIDQLMKSNLFEEALQLALNPQSRCREYKKAEVR